MIDFFKPKKTTKPSLLPAVAAGSVIESRGLVQYVNIASADIKWVDGTAVMSVDAQTRKPKLKVTFSKKGVYPFKVKLIAAKTNSIYSASEKSRNSHYTYTTKQRNYTTNPDGTYIVDDFELAVGGADTYTFEVSDIKDNILFTRSLETRRCIYLQEIKMRGDVEKTAASNLTLFTGELAKHGIDVMTHKTPTVLMKALENIGTNKDQALLIAEAKKAYAASSAPKYESYTIAMVYTGPLAKKDKDTVTAEETAKIGPKQKAVTVKIIDRKSDTRHLWNKVVTGDDWFVSGIFKPKDSRLANIVIPRKAVNAIEISTRLPGASTSVSVDVSSLSSTVQEGTISLVVDVVQGFLGGLAFIESNLIVISTRAWWRAYNTGKQNRIMIHELGHKLGLVPGGKAGGKIESHYDKTKLDQAAYFYESSQGHKGGHCHNGIKKKKAPLLYTSRADYKASTCVMYGAITLNSAFCTACAAAAKKTDISKGWKGF